MRGRKKNGKNVSIRVSGQRVQLVSRLQARSAPAGKYLVPGASHKRAMKGGHGFVPGDLWRPVPLPGAKGLKTTVINMGAN